MPRLALLPVFAILLSGFGCVSIPIQCLLGEVPCVTEITPRPGPIAMPPL